MHAMNHIPKTGGPDRMVILISCNLQLHLILYTSSTYRCLTI